MMPPDAADARAPDPRIEEIVEAVRASRKYAAISEAVVRRTAVQALRGQSSLRVADRSVRAKLHQATRAYLTPGQLARVEHVDFLGNLQGDTLGPNHAEQVDCQTTRNCGRDGTNDISQWSDES